MIYVAYQDFRYEWHNSQNWTFILVPMKWAIFWNQYDWISFMNKEASMCMDIHEIPLSSEKCISTYTLSDITSCELNITDSPPPPTSVSTSSPNGDTLPLRAVSHPHNVSPPTVTAPLIHVLHLYHKYSHQNQIVIIVILPRVKRQSNRL